MVSGFLGSLPAQVHVDLCGPAYGTFCRSTSASGCTMTTETFSLRAICHSMWRTANSGIDSAVKVH